MDSLSPRAVRCLRNPRELPGATPQSAFCSVPRLPRLPSLQDLDREVQLVGQDQGVVEILESKRDVTSTVSFEIVDEKYLQLEEDGSYLFGFNITNAASGDDLSSPWQISDVQVQLSGIKSQ